MTTADAQASTAASETLERLVTGRLDQLERNEKLVEDAARWGFPTMALVNDQTARLRFEANVAHKLKENPTMTSASATVQGHSNGPWYKSGVARIALIVVALVAIVLAGAFLLAKHDAPVQPPTTIVDTPSVPPVTPVAPPANIPTAPALTVSTVAGQADTADNRLTEMNEMCPSMESDLRDTMGNDFSFDYYKYYLPQSCGGYQSALVEAYMVQPPSLTAEELAQLNQLLAKQEQGL